MKKITTRDLLKDVLSQRGGALNDWKRLSRRKDEIGRVVREFQNKATGQVLEITETPDASHLVVEKTPANTAQQSTLQDALHGTAAKPPKP